MVKGSRKEPEFAQLKLRIPYALKKRLDGEAAEKRHSLNAECIFRLELSFRIESRESTEARLLALESTVASHTGILARGDKK